MAKPSDKLTPSILPNKAGTRPLTDADIKHLQPNPMRTATWYGWGFGARANADGTKTWLYSYNSPVTGKKPQMVLGTYPETTLAESRNKHADARNLVKLGRDPAIEAAQAKAEQTAALAAAIVPPAPTVREVFAEWKSDVLKAVLKDVKADDGAVFKDLKHSGYKDNGEFLKKQFEKHVFPRWGDKAIRDVDRPMALKLVKDTLGKGLLSTAGHLFTNLYSFFKFAHLTRGYISSNPLEGADKKAIVGKAPKGKRYLRDWELARLQRRLPNVNLHVVTQLALLFVLATGARPEEVAGLPKDEIDETAALWTVPPTRYKTGYRTETAHTVPLSARALRILEAAKAFNAGSDYVFPSLARRRTERTKEYLDRHSLSKGVARKLGTATPQDKEPAAGELGIAKFTPHDLRRSVRTGMSRIGVPPDIASRALGHTPPDSAPMDDVYDHHDYLPERRDAFDRWGRHLDSLA